MLSMLSRLGIVYRLAVGEAHDAQWLCNGCKVSTFQIPLLQNSGIFFMNFVRKWAKNKIPLLRNRSVNVIRKHLISHDSTGHGPVQMLNTWGETCLLHSETGPGVFILSLQKNPFQKISFERNITTYTMKIRKFLYPTAAWETYLIHDLFFSSSDWNR